MGAAKILFVTYGGGHANMVVPVAKAVAATSWGAPVVLALTSAAAPVRAAGLPVLQFKDFLRPDDGYARQWGERLLGAMSGANIDRQESIAYLGLSFSDLARELGEDEAQRQYAAKGRHAFLPVATLTRILDEVKPDLLVSTNSPRAEHAAFIAAHRLGIPSVCMIDTFIGDEALRLGARGYADAICALNESVRDVLVAAGAQGSAVHCTGNPAFDVLLDPACAEFGNSLRQRMGWVDMTVLLLPVQKFQAYHPLTGNWPEHESFPRRLESLLIEWVGARTDSVLCVRPRPDDPSPPIHHAARVLTTGGTDWPLGPLLHAVDVVVTMSSTVGFEGHLTGARLVQILGTPFDTSTPWLEFGVADRAVGLDSLAEALDDVVEMPRRLRRDVGPATPRVLEVLRGLIGQSTHN